MALVKAGRITTTGTYRESQGEICVICKDRKPVIYWADGVGRVCSDCDPKKSRPHLIEYETEPEK